MDSKISDSIDFTSVTWKFDAKSPLLYFLALVEYAGGNDIWQYQSTKIPGSNYFHNCEIMVKVFNRSEFLDL